MGRRVPGARRSRHVDVPAVHARHGPRRGCRPGFSLPGRDGPTRFDHAGRAPWPRAAARYRHLHSGRRNACDRLNLTSTTKGRLMRKVIVLMQVTLDGRISDADGSFWEPFAWGEEETAYVNEVYARANTWFMSRKLYEVVVPYWEQVAAGTLPDSDVLDSPASLEFARLLGGMTKVVLSRTLADDPATLREVRSGDAVRDLQELKEQDGADIVASFGPRTLGPLADVPGLIDEYVLVIHPAVLASGPRLFDRLTRDLGFTLASARVFDGGAAVMCYRTLEGAPRPANDATGAS